MITHVAVIGHPITHSLSPHLHGYWLQHYGIEGRYTAIDISPDVLETQVRQLLLTERYQGLNVTVPHKEAMVDYVDEVRGVARHIGAINTVVREGERIIGYNTDAYGFIANIQSHCPSYDFTGKKALLLGAGGAARAVIAGLLDASIGEILLANRTYDKAVALQQHFASPHIAPITWEERHDALAGVDIVINSTVLGMQGKAELTLDLAALPKEAIVTDIVYTPLHTALLREAKARGNIVVDGLGMLLYQAVPGFEMWFGKRPEVDEVLRGILLKELGHD